jgi:hypothetical protein
MSKQKFEDFLSQRIERAHEMLKLKGYYDPTKKLDLFDKARVSENLKELGVIHRFLGNLEASNENFLESSELMWGGEREQITPDDEHSENVGGGQLFAAICSNLGGDKERSMQLFKWAAENLELSPERIKMLKPPSPTEQSLQLGQLFLEGAYSLIHLGRWHEAQNLAEEVHPLFVHARSHSATIDADEWYLPDVIVSLCEHKVEDTAESKKTAQQALLKYKRGLRDMFDKLNGYFYIFDLQESFPEVYEPVIP